MGATTDSPEPAKQGADSGLGLKTALGFVIPAVCLSTLLMNLSESSLWMPTE